MPVHGGACTPSTPGRPQRYAHKYIVCATPTDRGALWDTKLSQVHTSVPDAYFQARFQDIGASLGVCRLSIGTVLDSL